jgi:hypothetical protein
MLFITVKPSQIGSLPDFVWRVFSSFFIGKTTIAMTNSLFLAAIPNFQVLSNFYLLLMSVAVANITIGASSYIKTKALYGKKIIPCTTLLLMTVFIFLAILQTYLVFAGMLERVVTVTAFEMTLYLIAVMCLVYLSYTVTPNYNAPDVHARLKVNKTYNLCNYYRRHRKSLAVAAFIFMIVVAPNYHLSHGAEANYWKERFLFHFVGGGLLVYIFRSKPGSQWFTLSHRLAAVAAIVMEILLIYVFR